MIDLNFLLDKKIGIFGFGTEGRSLSDFLLKNGINELFVFDDKMNNLTDNSLDEKLKFYTIDGSDEQIRNLDVVFRSPGIKIKKIETLVSEGCEISSSVELFLKLKLGLVIGITGTKGKSTTTSLLSKILENAGENVFVGGNIGISPLTFVDRLKDDSITILEMSSFQLQGIKYQPDISVILPIGIDHLDYHADEYEYQQAKAQIAGNESQVILPYEGETKRLFNKVADTEKFFYSINGEPCNGCSLNANQVTCSKDGVNFNINGFDVLRKNLKIPEANIMAALTCAFVIGIRPDIAQLIQNFENLPYRIQLIKDNLGIKYYNDSAATNPISTIQAIKMMNEDFVLICGGSSKGLSYQDLANEIAKSNLLKKVLLIGNTGHQIEKELNSLEYSNLLYVDSLQGAMDYIKNSDTKFKVVLFSPASASFDQYKDYKHRGEEFNKLIDV